MAFLKNRIVKLESQSDLDISYEDFVRYVHYKDTMNENEIRRVTSSRRYREIMGDMRHKNNLVKL